MEVGEKEERVMGYIKYSKSLSLECPHCKAICEFRQVPEGHTVCSVDRKIHIAYGCSHCLGLVVTKWNCSGTFNEVFEGRSYPMSYHPPSGNWKPKVDLSCIENNKVRKDFSEAIECFKYGLYNACMIMSRRAIQQEVLNKGATGENLYKQIESVGISSQLKSLLHKIKNFGNHGAHPDFFLFDENGNKIEDEKQFARLSLEFLDRYFADQYEIDALVESAPKSEKELEN